ncbi:methyl-accepting chemotaxis protein [Vibrio sp. ES.051]|uniref:methyl-accepting chemotaxis protein n=1 Tax=Vibrio sp. ES.051 TaxID=1761909 RepID=UPI000BF99BB2|nr:methyl-accepting chemotaxis protein [Vibrio sp. ES.051]PFG58283.1 methyl-accepting chemotaxis protein [Vibrio sp. ES.051]
MKKIGFKAKLTLSVIILVILSLLVSNWLSYVKIKQQIIDNIGQRSSATVNDQANRIEGWFKQKAQAIDVLTKDYQVEHNAKRLLETARLAQQTSNLATVLYGFDNGIAYSTLSGKGWNNGVADPNHYDPRSRPWYSQAKTADHVEFTDVYTDSTTGKYVISLVKSISGGAILGDIELDILSEVIANVKIPGSHAAIVDEAGNTLASNFSALSFGTTLNDAGLSDVQRMMSTEETNMMEYTFQGKEMVAYTRAINLSNDQRWYLFVNIDKSVAYSAANKALTESIISSIIMVLLSVTIVLGLLKVLYQPILNLKSLVIDLSQGNGDLTKRLPVDNDDDLGQISQGINTFVSRLQEMMLDISQSSQSISQSVNELKLQTETSTKLLDGHSIETEQIVTAVEEMSSTASDVANNTAQASQLTQSTHSQVTEISVTVNEAATTARKMIDDVDQVSERIININKETQEINRILDIIGEIADQTNLLALNAAIEAARAGEQGRGFAVVADEVRALAARTQASTVEIEQTVQQLRQSSNDAIEDMQITKESCNQTEQQSRRIVESLNSVGDSVVHVSDISVQIATATEQQNATTHEVSCNMSNIRDLVMKISQNGRDTSDEAINLAAANSQLKSVVEQFKLK